MELTGNAKKSVRKVETMYDDYEGWAEEVGEELSDVTISRFEISEDDEPYEDTEFVGWDKYHWGYGRNGWKVLVGKNDGIRFRACVVDPDLIVRGDWFPVDTEEDVERRIIEAESLMGESF